MKKLLLLLAFITFPCSANAADTYSFDPHHTNITWSANHFGFSSPSGKFTKSEGTVILNKASPNRSKVDITIQTASILTGIPKFDNYLKGSNFLNVSRFPTARFVSTKVMTRGSRIAKVSGDLTLLGITKPITLDVRLNKIGTNPFNQKKTAGFTAKGTINRSDFGMNFASPGVSDKVKINIEAEAILLPSNSTKAANSNNKSTKDSQSDGWKILTKNSKIAFTALQSGSKINGGVREEFNGNALFDPSKGSRIHGSFKNFNGTIIFDPSKLTSSKVDIEVDTGSIAIDFGDSAEILKSPEWLNAYEFPKATFTSKSFMQITDTNYVASGTLTIKKKSIPVSFNFQLSDYSKTNGKATATGSFTIRRSQFGIGNRDPKKANNIEDHITITFTIKAEK